MEFLLILLKIWLFPATHSSAVYAGTIGHWLKHAPKVFRPYFTIDVICYKLFPMNSDTPDKTPDEPLLLVVDDDKGIRDLLSRYLAQQGFRGAGRAGNGSMAGQ
jgi:hypothetical protein